MKKKALIILLAVSLCLNVVLLAIQCMSRRSQPLTGTFLCEGSSHSDGTYLTFDEKGSFTVYRQFDTLFTGTYTADANGVYILDGTALSVPYVVYAPCTSFLCRTLTPINASAIFPRMSMWKSHKYKQIKSSPRRMAGAAFVLFIGGGALLR